MSHQTLLSGKVHDGPLLDGRLKHLLAGKKIVLTGVTGFIGEQILWKILTELPDTTAGVLVRRKGSASARDRMVQLVKKRIFAEVRDAAGGAEELLDARVQVIEGDLPNVPDLPRDTDVLIHCAGDVSFDPPIDQAFKTNVLGTKALLDKLREAMSDADGNLVKVPHYVHVSTAYTAGRRRGAIPEAAHEHEVDYQVETEWALKLAERIEIESRSAERLTELREQAEKEHRQAGFLTTAADTERRRKEWVHEQLVLAGTERARSVGWTDVYTFAKAMGERIVADLGHDMQVSIVRPAIVESSLKHPYPGWIEGFKMAEPIILAYGKGDLPEIPASPDSVIDIIPCDMVVNCILAVCATQPAVGRPEFYHSNSGARNPLTFRDIYVHVRRYFTDHPFERGDRGQTKLPIWNWPGSAQVERFLATSEVASKWADRVLSFAPRSARTRAYARSLDKATGRLGFLRRYLTIYGEYLRTELHFVDDHTLALHRSLHPDDVDTWAFDSAAVDWTEYIEEIHCPAVTAPVRRMDAVRRRRGNTASTYRDLSRSTADPKSVVAVFDLDGTVMSGNVVETYLWAKLPELGAVAKASEIASLVKSLPSYLRAERRDRGTFLRALYRRYEGADLAALEETVDERISEHILDRLSPDAVRRIREHRAQGHTTVLMTGAIRPLTRPLRPLFDVIVAAELAVDEDGRCTGFLTGPPMVGESRSAWLRHWASLNGIDLAQSYAYADSHVDLPMLSVVGHPVAVNPDIGLMRAAQKNSWSVVEWAAMSQTPRWSITPAKEK
ncbi:HAD-IB family hydrolase [Granulicoccus sp. GXG6511]|uniref:HAD-IB family hydrolase n=1 Tax=Granulicoccus sp. GXG6511 TaxID=3381351 RepID=UPI003D7F106B